MDITNIVPAAECQTTEWSEWESCSVTCGQGIRMRRRNFVLGTKARAAGCSTTLLDKENCDSECVGEISCATTAWSNWSECSVTCGKGYRTRTRLFISRAARKVCSQVDLVEREPCTGVLQECLETEEVDPKCQVTAWSDWSPCTASCGKGVKLRQRMYMSPSSLGSCSTELMQKAACSADRVDCSIELDEARGN